MRQSRSEPKALEDTVHLVGKTMQHAEGVAGRKWGCAHADPGDAPSRPLGRLDPRASVAAAGWFDCLCASFSFSFSFSLLIVSFVNCGKFPRVVSSGVHTE